MYAQQTRSYHFRKQWLCADKNIFLKKIQNNACIIIDNMVSCSSRFNAPTKTWLVGQEAKTLPSHGRITGSIPIRATLCLITVLLWLVGQEAKTLPSHGRITGSIPIRATDCFKPLKRKRAAQPESYRRLKFAVYFLP